VIEREPDPKFDCFEAPVSSDRRFPAQIAFFVTHFSHLIYNLFTNPASPSAGRNQSELVDNFAGIRIGQTPANCSQEGLLYRHGFIQRGTIWLFTKRW
jgi:hypothetical protein